MLELIIALYALWMTAFALRALIVITPETLPPQFVRQCTETEKAMTFLKRGY